MDTNNNTDTDIDTVIIGAGQAGLATATSSGREGPRS
jgi:cation diffusion facilitator CzcD-associated flavoprotein CzcO